MALQLITLPTVQAGQSLADAEQILMKTLPQQELQFANEMLGVDSATLGQYTKDLMNVLTRDLASSVNQADGSNKDTLDANTAKVVNAALQGIAKGAMLGIMGGLDVQRNG